MQLTTDYLKRAFIQYNKEIFHEELPLPILKISNASIDWVPCITNGK